MVIVNHMTVNEFPTLCGQKRNLGTGWIRRLVAHLIVKEISQAIMNECALVEFHFKRHMGLAPTDDHCAILCNLLKGSYLP